jgi:hypothetical protein
MGMEKDRHILMQIGGAAWALELSTAQVRQLICAGILPAQRTQEGTYILSLDDVVRCSLARRIDPPKPGRPGTKGRRRG